MNRIRAVQRGSLLLALSATLGALAGCAGSATRPQQESVAPPMAASAAPSETRTAQSTPTPTPFPTATPSTKAPSANVPTPKAPPEAAVRRTIHARDHAETAWASPTGNILCATSSAHRGRPGVRCEIFEHHWKASEPPPKDCDAEFWGSGIELSGTAGFACSEDPPGIPDPGSASTWWWHEGDPTATGFDGRWSALRYDTALVLAPGLRCISRSTGMTCRDDRSGHGFAISEQRYQIW